MKLTINGVVPSQKNRKIIGRNKTTGKPFVLSEQSVKDWQETALIQLRQQFKGLVVTDYPIAINVTVYYGNNNRHDLDNALSTVMDALKAAEVIVDDDTKHISCITVQYGGYDKINPRVEVYLDE